MAKYKVKDMATDLGVENKKIIEILENHCGVKKKTMTSLEEDEISLIFDVITQENKVESFDGYFALRNGKIEEEPETELVEEKQEKSEQKNKKPADNKANKSEKTE